MSEYPEGATFVLSESKVWQDRDATIPAKPGDKIGAITFDDTVVAHQATEAHRPRWTRLFKPLTTSDIRRMMYQIEAKNY